MLAMDRPSPSLSRYLLLRAPAPSRTHPDAPKVRRYRLARIELNGRSAPGDRFAHLHRFYD